MHGEGEGEVVLKGTGKAIQKVLQLALWFQHRSGECGYCISDRDGSSHVYCRSRTANALLACCAGYRACKSFDM